MGGRFRTFISLQLFHKEKEEFHKFNLFIIKSILLIIFYAKCIHIASAIAIYLILVNKRYIIITEIKFKINQ